MSSTQCKHNKWMWRKGASLQMNGFLFGILNINPTRNNKFSKKIIIIGKI